MNKTIKIIACIFGVLMLLGIIMTPATPTDTTVSKTNDQVANELMDILTKAEFKNDFKIVVTDYDVQFYMDGVATLSDYQKKQLITVLVKTVHSVRNDDKGASTIIYDEYGVEVASARLSFWDNSVTDMKIN